VRGCSLARLAQLATLVSQHGVSAPQFSVTQRVLTKPKHIPQQRGIPAKPFFSCSMRSSLFLEDLWKTPISQLFIFIKQL
jgi:hypothetical protein